MSTTEDGDKIYVELLTSQQYFVFPWPLLHPLPAANLSHSLSVSFCAIEVAFDAAAAAATTVQASRC